MPDPGKTGLKKWLPDLDSNQDKLNQNQLCYRYTIGQNRRQYTALLAKIKPGIEKKQKKAQKSHKNMKMPLLKAILCVEEYRFEKAFLSDFAFEVQMLPKSNCI